MQTVFNKVACINERGNIAVAVVVVLLFSSVLSSPLLACNVTNVDLHVGSTPSIACEDDLTTAYVGNPFYTCVEWTADLPDDDPFEYFYEEYIGEGEWQQNSGVGEFLSTYRHFHHTISWWESGQHTLRIKIRRKDVGDSWHPSNACTVTVVKVDKIKIEYAPGSWDDVTGDTIVVLKGTKYTFKAFPNPASASWPANSPVWSGVASGTSEEIEVTFDSAGTYSLTAKCGPYDTGKKVDIEVIVPQIDEVKFVDASGVEWNDIYDGSDRWRMGRTGQTAENDPGCFVKNKKTAVRIKFWHEKSLSYTTEVKVWGDVDWWDEDTTGGNYPGTTSAPTMDFGTSWPSPSSGHVIVSPGTIQDFVHRDSVDIEWRYKVPWGTDSWIGAGDSLNLKYYIVWDEHKNGAPKSSAGSFSDSDYTKDHIKEAIELGKDVSGTDEKYLADKVCDSVHRSLVYGSGPSPYSVSNCWGIHDTSTGDCGHLAAELCYVMRCLGVAMFMAHANLRDVTGGLNTTGAQSGKGTCDDHDDTDIDKMGETFWTTNYWQGCAYISEASPRRDTLCWDTQHNHDRKKYWELGNDKDDPVRAGILFDYHWKTHGEGGGEWQQLLGSGDYHDECSRSPDYEYFGN
ncbi:MAG: hypothetical protein KAV87_63720 [Desulfobacteraceae bacterium]|nr:hypothetical protein [Desulfobacteraceae bacterium]